MIPIISGSNIASLETAPRSIVRYAFIVFTFLLTNTTFSQSQRDIDQAAQLFRQGQAAYEEGRFSEAAEKMKAAYELTRAAELAFNVGRAYERMSEYDEAIRYFRIYLRRGSPDERERSDIQGRINALQAAKRRQRDQVFTMPPSTDELTHEARTFFRRGVTMYRQGHYEAAMQAFIAAHRFAPLPEVLYNMAMTARRLGQTRDAIDYFREYLRRRPNAPDRFHVEHEIEEMRSSR